MASCRSSFLRALLCCLGLSSPRPGRASEPLAFPPEIIARSGTPIVLRLGPVLFTDPLSGEQFYTRGYNGAVPGPTIRVSPGQRIELTVYNDLGPSNADECAGAPGAMETHFCMLNITNFHTHGLHVSNDVGSDNIFVSIQPGESGVYNISLPAYHMGGTNIYHPHHHHSTVSQAGGGAHGALIVDDPAGSLPPEVANMPERIIVISVLNLGDVSSPWALPLASVEQIGKGHLFKTTSKALVPLVNGMYRPRLMLPAGVYHRFRLAHVSDDATTFLSADSSDATCELRVLAKDGVYVDPTPRRVPSLYMASGNRVDMLMACVCKTGSSCSARIVARVQNAGPAGQNVQYNDTLFSLAVEGSSSAIADLEPFRVNRPCYLVDISRAEVPAANKHNISMLFVGNDAVMQWDGNGGVWSPGTPLAAVAAGQIHEWTITGVMEHPFHMHTVHVQVVSTNGTSTSFMTEGDWHDSLLMPGTNMAVVRTHTATFGGKYVMHCHVLNHHDLGMMGYLDVQGASALWSGARAVDPLCRYDDRGVGFKYLYSKAEEAASGASRQALSVLVLSSILCFATRTAELFA